MPPPALPCPLRVLLGGGEGGEGGEGGRGARAVPPSRREFSSRGEAAAPPPLLSPKVGYVVYVYSPPSLPGYPNAFLMLYLCFTYAFAMLPLCFTYASLMILPGSLKSHP